MPTTIDAPASLVSATPETSIALPGTVGHPIRPLRRHRDRRVADSARREVSDPADPTAAAIGIGLTAASRTGTVLDFRGVEARTVDRARPSPARPAGRSLGWLRAGAAVARYSLRFLPAVLRSHSCVPPATLPVLRMTTSLPGHRIDEWKAFFRCSEDATPSFTYFTAENSRLLFRLLSQFGLNFRHLVLVQHDLVAHYGAGGLIPDVEHTLEAQVQELRVWPRQRVTLACRCVVRRAGDPAPVCETSDRFLVKEVPVGDCEALGRRGEVLCGEGNEPPAVRLDSTSPSVRRHEFHVPMDAGVGFGLLSGDLNLVHAHVGLARLFGHRRPFAQGLYTSNQVVATLARLAGQVPTRLSVRFCRPLFLGQDALLLHSESAFEVLAANGSLVAAGTFGA